ncbi:MAG: N-acetylglucosamine kinase [Taibaiella sp.]|nr:N-acetylglucosamine kinase [Taibaiella sp.]
MNSVLLAESGSTKTDWCLITKGKKPVHISTQGINPYIQQQDDILALLKAELPARGAFYNADAIRYYGAGAGSAQRQNDVLVVLKKHFEIKDVEVKSDMLAAARGLCGENSGVVSILGTGSNSCYYNGKAIKEQKASLGYIAGDEGSGNQMGKRVLQYYAYNTFDTELKMGFELLFGNDIPAIIYKLYSRPFPNRYLASFTELLVKNRGHFMVENIIEDCFNDFFQHHILKYRQSWKLPLYFTGSIAFAFKDVLYSLCEQYELEIANVEKSPMNGLIKYYRGLMK